jgi:DNA mismatch repair protein MSH4
MFTPGICLAKLTSLPDSLLTRATQVSEMLTERARERKLSSKTHILTERRRLILQLHETLKQAANGTMDDEALARWLRRIQTRFVEDFASLA